jgi:hypothetical protein
MDDTGDKGNTAAGDDESSDELVEGSENLTQQRIGEGEARPADVSWDETNWGETDDSPHEGEEGQDSLA